jgi:outer membrane protein TolC
MPGIAMSGQLEKPEEPAITAGENDLPVDGIPMFEATPDQGLMLVRQEEASDTFQLNDTHLDDVLRLSLQRNRTIISSEQQIEAANARVMQARSIYGTRLTGNFQQTRVDDVAKTISAGKTVELGKRDSQNAYLEVTQPLFLSGKDRAALRSARLGRAEAGSGHTYTRQTIVMQTIMRWLAWLFSVESEAVSQKDLELAQVHFDLVSSRFKQKQVSQFEVLRAEVRLAQARSVLRRQTNSRELACLDLLRILDLPEDTLISTRDRLEMVKYDINLARDASAAIELREDLKMKRLEVEIARQGVAAARSENQPVVSIFGQSGIQDPSSKSSMGNYERKGYWKAGVVANFTLNDGGMRKGKVKEAHSRLAIAENSLLDAIEQANIEIKQAFLTIQTAEEVVQAQEKAVKQAEEALRLAGVRYRNGLFTQVELFDAENAYLATRLQYVQAIFAYDQALVSYGLAIGQLGRKLFAVQAKTQGEI